VSATTRLKRLCELRRLEERNEACLLGSAAASLQRLDDALKHERVRKEQGRILIGRSVGSGETEDRIAGLEEIAGATRKTGILMGRMQRAQENVRRVRERYLGKRTELRQAEALLRAAVENESNAALRRSQAELDEWHRTLQVRLKRDAIEDGLSEDSTRT